MASSERKLIPIVLEAAIALRPSSVLDLGCGTGKWGRLLREYLDVWAGRGRPAEWKVAIHGVEIWRWPWWDSYFPWYDKVEETSATSYLVRCPPYDLVVCVAMLEHLEMADGLDCLALIQDKTKRLAIVSTPIGWMPQGEVAGNPHEEHKSAWHPKDFRRLGWEIAWQGEGRMVATWRRR